MVYGISSTVSLVVMIFASLFSTELQNLLFNSTQVMDMSLFIYILWGLSFLLSISTFIEYSYSMILYHKSIKKASVKKKKMVKF